MGLGIAVVKLNLELWQRGLFKNIESALDIGSQELHLKPVDFENLINAAGISDYKKEKFAELANWPGRPRCSAKPFYELLGINDYSCIDLNGKQGAIQLDLNLPLEDKTFYNKYGLVTDYGCNEHAFNVGEAYRTMHRLCKPGGLMVICQAMTRGNGYYMFDLSFFEGIAASNGYKVLFSSYIAALNACTKEGTPLALHLPLSRELLDVMDWTKISNIGIAYVLEKQSDADFRFPYQGGYMSQNQGHYGYKMQFLPDPPSRTYIPMPELNLKGIKTEDLVKCIMKRAKNKINGK